MDFVEKSIFFCHIFAHVYFFYYLCTRFSIIWKNRQYPYEEDFIHCIVQRAIFCPLGGTSYALSF